MQPEVTGEEERDLARSERDRLGGSGDLVAGEVALGDRRGDDVATSAASTSGDAIDAFDAESVPPLDVAAPRRIGHASSFRGLRKRHFAHLQPSLGDYSQRASTPLDIHSAPEFSRRMRSEQNATSSTFIDRTLRARRPLIARAPTETRPRGS